MREAGIKVLCVATIAACTPSTAHAAAYFFSTGLPNGAVAALSSPAGGYVETEAADDFVVTTATRITSATFTGLVPQGATVSSVNIAIYRVFPLDSGVPSGGVPTRVNSPSDTAFDVRSSAGGSLSFTTALLSPNFTAANSVVNGINRSPNSLTGGEGPVAGQEVLFTVNFASPFLLPADHYFFRPEVGLSNGSFLWLSTPNPIVPPGTPFSPDLQAWIRNTALAPDWLRIGTDITGQGPLNMAFSLTGVETAPVPEPATWMSIIAGFGLTGGVLRQRRVRAPARAARRRGAR